MTRLQASLGFVMASVIAGMLLAGSPASTIAGDDSAAPTDQVPKFSTIASAEDLAAEVKILIADLDKAVVDEDEYKGQVEGRFIRDGNTITLVAIALGLHDQDSPLKPHAKAIAGAARKLAHTKDFAATKQTSEDLKVCFATTKQAIEDLKAAVDGQGAGSGELKWAKVAALEGLMKDEVPHIFEKNLKDSLRHFKKRAGGVSANAATVALIAENANLYVADTKKPTEGKKWLEFAAQMRSAASEVAAKAHAGDETGAKAAMEKLNQSCHDCHAVFNPEKK